jgi:hypothetical protein
MATFVNTPATFPDGPGGKRCRREKKSSKRRAARTPAWNMGVAKDIMTFPLFYYLFEAKKIKTFCGVRWQASFSASALIGYKG